MEKKQKLKYAFKNIRSKDLTQQLKENIKKKALQYYS